MVVRKTTPKRSSAKKKTTKRKAAKRKSTKRRTTRRSTSTSQKVKEICFAIMPFGGWLDVYYENIYCPAIEAAGLKPHRADDIFRPGTIVTDIWDYTKRAKLLLADLTGKNPNVFYELGLAHALKKPAILIAESMDDIPFDLRALRIIIYDKNAPNWGKILREKIENSIEEIDKTRGGTLLPAFLDMRSPTKSSATPREKEILELRQENNSLRRELLSGAARLDEASQSRASTLPSPNPLEATELITKMVKAGFADTEIIEQLQQRGVPTFFVTSELKRLRFRKRKKPTDSQ